MVAPNEYQQVIRTVSNWSFEDRASLIRALVDAMRSETKSTSGLRMEDLVGIARGKGPAPTDEQVKQWIHEHRMEKYG